MPTWCGQSHCKTVFQLSLAEGNNLDCWTGGPQDTFSHFLKRPSNYCLIHFYKRCVSKPCPVQAAFLQDQWGFTKTQRDTTLSWAPTSSSVSTNMLPVTVQTLSPPAHSWPPLPPIHQCLNWDFISATSTLSKGNSHEHCALPLESFLLDWW